MEIQKSELIEAQSTKLCAREGCGHSIFLHSRRYSTGRCAYTKEHQDAYLDVCDCEVFLEPEEERRRVLKATTGSAVVSDLSAQLCTTCEHSKMEHWTMSRNKFTRCKHTTFANDVTGFRSKTCQCKKFVVAVTTQDADDVWECPLCPHTQWLHEIDELGKYHCTSGYCECDDTPITPDEMREAMTIMAKEAKEKALGHV